LIDDIRFIVPRTLRTIGAVSGERNPNASRPKPVIVGKTSREPPRYRQVDVEDSATSLAVEMMVGQHIPVIARCALRTGNLVDLTPGDEHFEISIHGPE
jgi:hypothetical protein